MDGNTKSKENFVLRVPEGFAGQTTKVIPEAESELAKLWVASVKADVNSHYYLRRDLVDVVLYHYRTGNYDIAQNELNLGAMRAGRDIIEIHEWRRLQEKHTTQMERTNYTTQFTKYQASINEKIFKKIEEEEKKKSQCDPARDKKKFPPSDSMEIDCHLSNSKDTKNNNNSKDSKNKYLSEDIKLIPEDTGNKIFNLNNNKENEFRNVHEKCHGANADELLTLTRGDLRLRQDRIFRVKHFVKRAQILQQKVTETFRKKGFTIQKLLAIVYNNQQMTIKRPDTGLHSNKYIVWVTEEYLPGVDNPELLPHLIFIRGIRNFKPPDILRTLYRHDGWNADHMVHCFRHCSIESQDSIYKDHLYVDLRIGTNPIDPIRITSHEDISLYCNNILTPYDWPFKIATIWPTKVTTHIDDGKAFSICEITANSDKDRTPAIRNRRNIPFSFRAPQSNDMELS